MSSLFIEAILKEIDHAHVVFQAKEDETTWQSFEDWFKKLIIMLDTKKETIGGIELNESYPLIIQSIKDLRLPIHNSILSERTRLSGTATEFIQKLTVFFGKDFDALVDIYAPAIIKLTGRANKVFVIRANACMDVILKIVKPVRLFPKFLDLFSSTNKTVRIAAATYSYALLEVSEKSTLDDYVGVLSDTLKLGLNDAAPEVRALASKSFQIFKSHFEERANQFLSLASPHLQKVLQMVVERNGKGTTVGKLNLNKYDLKKTIQKSKEQMSKSSLNKEDELFISYPKEENDLEKISKKENTSNTLTMPKAERVNVPMGERNKAINKSPKRIPRKPLVEIEPSGTPNSSLPLIGSAVRVPRPVSNTIITATEARSTILNSKAVAKPFLENTPKLPIAQRNLYFKPSPFMDDGQPSTFNSPISIKVNKYATLPNMKLSSEPKPFTKPAYASNLSIASAETPQTNITDIIKYLKDFDWSKRQKGLEELKELIKETDSEHDARLPKVIEILVSSLSDNHFRVISTALNIIYTDSLKSGAKIMELFIKEDKASQLLAKLMDITTNVQYKGKAQLLSLANEVLVLLQSYYKKDESQLLNIFIMVLYSQEFSAISRLRHLYFKLLKEALSPLRTAPLSTFYKNLFGKVIPLLSELDPNAKNSLKDILLQLHALDENTFYSSLAGSMRLVQRKTVSDLIANHIPDFVKKEDIAYKAKLLRLKSSHLGLASHSDAQSENSNGPFKLSRTSIDGSDLIGSVKSEAAILNTEVNLSAVEDPRQAQCLTGYDKEQEPDDLSKTVCPSIRVYQDEKADFSDDLEQNKIEEISRALGSLKIISSPEVIQDQETRFYESLDRNGSEEALQSSEGSDETSQIESNEIQILENLSTDPTTVAIYF